jgi:hypothetical protein
MGRKPPANCYSPFLPPPRQFSTLPGEGLGSGNRPAYSTTRFCRLAVRSGFLDLAAMRAARGDGKLGLRQRG